VRCRAEQNLIVPDGHSSDGLLAHRKRENEQTRHRKPIIFVNETADAKTFDDCRMLISCRAAANQLDQQSLLGPG
jgi:hypothetical protein